MSAYIFDLMEKFAGYGFNKSHAAAYSLLAYHTAWIKVHYTAEFYCANMTVEMDNTDKLMVLFEDAQHLGRGVAHDQVEGVVAGRLALRLGVPGVEALPERLALRLLGRHVVQGSHDLPVLGLAEAGGRDVRPGARDRGRGERDPAQAERRGAAPGDRRVSEHGPRATPVERATP